MSKLQSLISWWPLLAIHFRREREKKGKKTRYMAKVIETPKQPYPNPFFLKKEVEKKTSTQIEKMVLA